MGITDSILDKLGDIATQYVIDELVDLVRAAAQKILGDEKDDGLAEAVARAGVEGMAARAAHEIAERKARGNLDAKAAEVLGAIARIDVDKLFAPKAVEAGPMSAKYTCELTHESWMRLRAANPGITVPTDGEIERLGAVGVLNDTVITISDADRRVPLDIARILERTP